MGISAITTGLGKYDSALEILGNDASKDASDLRGEITWKQKNWAAAGPLFEKALDVLRQAGGVTG